MLYKVLYNLVQTYILYTLFDALIVIRSVLSSQFAVFIFEQMSRDIFIHYSKWKWGYMLAITSESPKPNPALEDARIPLPILIYKKNWDISMKHTLTNTRFIQLYIFKMCQSRALCFPRTLCFPLKNSVQVQQFPITISQKSCVFNTWRWDVFGFRFVSTYEIMLYASSSRFFFSLLYSHVRDRGWMWPVKHHHVARAISLISLFGLYGHCHQKEADLLSIAATSVSHFRYHSHQK